MPGVTSVMPGPTMPRRLATSSAEQTRPSTPVSRACAARAELAAARAAQARDTGVDGLVCSAEEVANLRGIVGPGMTLVTPGIRPAGSASGDQKRIMTPARAIEAGADYLVVGRPVVEARDPKAAADAIVGEIEQVMGK